MRVNDSAALNLQFTPNYVCAAILGYLKLAGDGASHLIDTFMRSSLRARHLMLQL